MHGKHGWMWAVEAKRWMIKDGHADKEKCNLKFLNTIGKNLLLIPAISCFVFTLRQYTETNNTDLFVPQMLP